MKKFNIVRLGCPKNDADMDILRGIFENKNYIYEENPAECDYIIIDTCGFIDSAKKESVETILEYSQYREINPKVKIIAVGCFVQRYYDELKKDMTEADGLIGVVPPQKIYDTINSEKFSYYNEIPEDTYKCEYRYIPETPYAYVKIADGCSRKCAFCSIPYFKGDPKSREIEDIKNEVEFLVKNGKKEIILVSQDNTLYGINIYKKQALPDLLAELNSIPGNFWIRVMYLHPDFLSDEIIDSIHKNEKVLNYFDVPMQCGSDSVLKLMGRIKNTGELEKLSQKIRKTPSILRTSIIVGFPGESEEDFEKTLDFIDKTEFDKLGAFVYSEEEGTPAQKIKPKISKKVKEKRLETLMNLQKDISSEKMESYIDDVLDVLIEEYDNGVYIGRTFMDAPDIDGNVFVKSENQLNLNEFYKVKITGSYEYDLEGEIIGGNQ